MTEVEESLPAFVIPLQKSNIMLPNASVAEIIPYEPLQRVQDTPDWFIGVLAWRGVQVPVVSFEMLTVKRASFSLVSVSSASLVVLRALGGWQGFQYFALVAQALPRLVRVTADELFQAGEDVAATELLKARYGELLVSIPDVDYIEAQIDQIAFETVL
jgi:chemosensory pili system protein ChpC